MYMMMLDSEKVLHVVALVALWTCVVGHTVYRYPNKEPVPHAHPHQEHGGQQQGYGSHHHSHPHRPRVYTSSQSERKQARRSVPYTACQYNGDILKNPGDRCSYLECHYGDEPWYNRQGKAQLYARIRQCPQGTAVAKDAKQVIFRPIQYDPTRRVHQGHGKGYSDAKGYGHQGYGYHKGPTYEYKNTYEDMTPICSELVDGYSCKGY